MKAVELAVSVDNRKINVGAFQDGVLISVFSLHADPRLSVQEYATTLANLLAFSKIPISAVHAVSLASIVPNLTITVKEALSLLFACSPFEICAGVKTGLNTKLQNVAAIGADFICNCVGALHRYCAPLIVVDLSGATTFAAIDSSGTLIGRTIFPGLSSCRAALSRDYAQLAQISLEGEANLMGKNTAQAMLSGLLYGTASLVDGMISSYREQLDGAQVVITGDEGERILHLIRCDYHFVSHLQLEGILHISHKNLSR